MKKDVLLLGLLLNISILLSMIVDSPIFITNSHEITRAEVPEAPEDFPNLIHN